MSAPVTYLGFNIADSMFDDVGDCLILRSKTDFLRVRNALKKGVVSCLNPSHKNTIAELERRYQVSLPVPARPERVTLKKGDTIIIISSRGLPRKTGNIVEFSAEELKRASFNFATYTLLEHK